MLFKLSLKNIKKSFKDYAIYFLTLVLGIAIFYMFNSLDSQQAMLQVSQSTKDIITLMINMLGLVSVFVAVILALLIVYANNFIVNRRKKEFGIYMTLGMGKRQISKIILLETIFIGIISLAVGILVGVLGAQFMSILVAKLFEADMSEFTFVFSKTACIKTCIYFAIMYLVVIIFNAITISKYKLINLLTANKKNETVKIKNPIICIIVFLISIGILAYDYYKVTGGVKTLSTVDKLIPIILSGIVATILFFWSLSGFILKIVQTRKKVYYKDANMFVLRQLNNKINTTVISISLICLMLFMTISILSSAFSLRNTMQKDLKEMTPVDLNLYKTVNLPENYTTSKGDTKKYTQQEIEESRITMEESLSKAGFDMNLLKDIVEIPIYATNELTLKDSFGKQYERIKNEYSMMIGFDLPETIVKISDYNKIARLYGQEEYSLNDDEYMVLCDFDSLKVLRDSSLRDNTEITVSGKKYKPKYDECKEGFIMISTSHTNGGIVLVPDSCNLTEDMKEQSLLAANYNTDSEDEKEKIDEMLAERDSEVAKKMLENGVQVDGLTKIVVISSSVGIATIITFIAIYLGIIFLIASSAILALKQLTESSDNKQRYRILRRIGADEKMINRALFRQIGIFFILPLILAGVHSIFGIQFAMSMMAGLCSPEDLLPSIIVSVIAIGGIYGLYFLATYLESKNIIREED